MTALATGAKAPEFELKTLEGKRFSLNEELAKGPVVLAFFKVSCPTCQYAFPYLERLYKAYRHRGNTKHICSSGRGLPVRIPTVGALSCTYACHFSYNPGLSLRYNSFRTSDKCWVSSDTASFWGRDRPCRE